MFRSSSFVYFRLTAVCPFQEIQLTQNALSVNRPTIVHASHRQTFTNANLVLQVMTVANARNSL